MNSDEINFLSKYSMNTLSSIPIHPNLNASDVEQIIKIAQKYAKLP